MRYFKSTNLTIIGRPAVGPAVFLGFCCLLLARMVWADGFVVVAGQGKAACGVALRPGATVAERTALSNLVKYVEKSTGVILPEQAWTEASASGTNRCIYLGVAAPGAGNGGWLGRTNDGFTVTVAREEIRILGNNPPSLIYGVASFLERYLGVRWLAPGELWTVVPRRKALVIPLGQYAENAAFPNRGLHILATDERGGVKYPHWNFDAADWMMFNRLNRKVEHVHRTGNNDVLAERGITPLRSGHALKSWMPNELFYDDHPEFYRFDGVERVRIRGGGTQLDYSSVEMSEAFARRVLNFIRNYPGEPPDWICISLNDGYGFSLDPQSRKEWFFDAQGKLSLSDNVFGFTRRVADIVVREFPQVVISQLAYTPYYHEPPRFELPPNMGIEFTVYRGSSMHPLCEGTNEKDREMRRQLEAWRAKTDKLMLYEYLGLYWADGLFANGVGMIAPDIRWYKKLGFQGVFSDFLPGKAKREMFYVYAHMLWNPERNYMDVIADFYAAAYGLGREKMLAAYAEYRRAAESRGGDQLGSDPAIALSHVSGFQEKMFALIDQGGAAAQEESEKARIRFVRDEFAQFMKRAEPYADYVFPIVPAALTPATLMSPDNLAPDPSFEANLKGWNFFKKRGKPKGVLAQDVAWHGTQSLAIVTAPGEFAGGRWVANVPVQKGEVYNIELMWKGDRQAADNLAILSIQIGGVAPRVRSFQMATTTEWSSGKYFGRLAVQDQITINLELWRGTGAVYFDAVRVEKARKKTTAGRPVLVPAPDTGGDSTSSVPDEADTLAPDFFRK